MILFLPQYMPSFFLFIPFHHPAFNTHKTNQHFSPFINDLISTLKIDTFFNKKTVLCRIIFCIFQQRPFLSSFNY